MLVDLIPSDSAEDELWAHGLYVEDAYAVLDEARYKVFRDPGRPGRLKLIGVDATGRLLTIVVTQPNDRGESYIITGWLADLEEQVLWARPGGTRHA